MTSENFETYVSDSAGILPPFTKVSSNHVKLLAFVELFALIILTIKKLISAPKMTEKN